MIVHGAGEGAVARRSAVAGGGAVSTIGFGKRNSRTKAAKKDVQKPRSPRCGEVELLSMHRTACTVLVLY